MLGTDVVAAFSAAGAQLQQLSHQQLDVCDSEAVHTAVLQAGADWIVNCSAYTAVDDAETEYAKAFAVNASAVAHIARAAASAGTRVLHVSTDYVFGGQGSGSRQEPYSEEDAVAPCGIYGHSKLYGEELLRSILPDSHLVLRTSWLHGIHGKNFVDTMLRVGAERDELRVVDDQRGSPTWTPWLAAVMEKLVAKDARGVVHACSRGDVTWHDFAAEIFKQAGIEVKLSRQSTEELARPAPRPAYSTLSVAKLEEILGEPCIDWRECVAEHLSAREAAQ